MRQFFCENQHYEFVQGNKQTQQLKWKDWFYVHAAFPLNHNYLLAFNMVAVGIINSFYDGYKIQQHPSNKYGCQQILSNFYLNVGIVYTAWCYSNFKDKKNKKTKNQDKRIRNWTISVQPSGSYRLVCCVNVFESALKLVTNSMLAA